MYGRELVDLQKESRWEFLNMLFSVSEAVAYMQVVYLIDYDNAKRPGHLACINSF